MRDAAAPTRHDRSLDRRPISNRKQGLDGRGTTSIRKMILIIIIIILMMAFEWTIYSHTRENVRIVVITMMAFASRRRWIPRARHVRVNLLLLHHHHHHQPHVRLQPPDNLLRPRIGRMRHNHENSVNHLLPPLLPQQPPPLVEIRAIVFGVPTLVVVDLIKIRKRTSRLFPPTVAMTTAFVSNPSRNVLDDAVHTVITMMAFEWNR